MSKVRVPTALAEPEASVARAVAATHRTDLREKEFRFRIVL
jgi:hypothetical protein